MSLLNLIHLTVLRGLEIDFITIMSQNRHTSTTNVGKTVAIDAGRKLVEKATKTLSTPKLQVANLMVSPEEIN